MDDPGSAYHARARIDRRPWWPIAVLVGGVVLIAHAILLAVVGVPWAPEGGPEQAALPTGAAPASTPWVPPPSPTPLAGVVLRPSADPAGQQWARLPDVIPVVVERDDPVGDVMYAWYDDRGSPTRIAKPPGAMELDITHLAAWMADGALRAEVTLLGIPPVGVIEPPGWQIGLRVRHGGGSFEALVCSNIPCVSWPAVPSSANIRQQSAQWVIAFEMTLRDIDEFSAAGPVDAAAPGGYEVSASARVEADGYAAADLTLDSQWAGIVVPEPETACPSDSTPDLPGPVDQARPPTDVMSMTFDREARQIVLLATVPDATGATETTQTWTFDVCTNRWSRRGGDGAWKRALLAYDGDSRAVVAFAPQGWGEPVYAASVLDRATGRWDRRSAGPMQQLLGIAYEPRSGQIVVHGMTATSAGPELWAYDVERDAWARLRQIDPPNLGSDPQHELLAYDPKRQRVVLHLIDRSWEFDPASGRWSTDHASSWPVNGGFFGNPGSIATDEASGRVVIYSEGHVLAYDGAAGRWESIETLERQPDRPGVLIGQSIVYDPLNRRLVVYGGRPGYPCQDSTVVWAFDPLTGEWTLLLAQTAADLRVSGDSGQATPIPGRSPWISAAGVTLHGGPFFTRVAGVADEPWSSTPPAAAASVADGLLLPECQLWTEGTVWWEETTSDPASRAWIEIDLGGTFVLDAALVQADVNDAYRLSYRNQDTATWTLLWDIPLGDAGGMATRPAQGHPGVHWSLPRPVVTDALRFEAVSGDNQYSVSEIAVFGRPAP